MVILGPRQHQIGDLTLAVPADRRNEIKERRQRLTQ